MAEATDRELLELLVRKVSGLEAEIPAMKGDISGIKEGQMRLEESQMRLEESQMRLKEGQTRLEEGQARLEERQKKLEEGQSRMEAKIDLIYNHTAKLTEDVTVIKTEIKELRSDVDFLFQKELKNERDIFSLKRAVQPD